jgi:hydrogenase 3 maturation protease
VAEWGEPDVSRGTQNANGSGQGHESGNAVGDGLSRGVVIGIGNDLRGDDGAGLIAARELAEETGAPLILAGEVPENYLDVVRRYAPEWVLLVDAADFGAQAGETVILRFEPSKTSPARGVSPSTHHPSLTLLRRYIAEEMGAEVWLLGIQPKRIDPGAPLSDEVREAIPRAVRIGRDWMRWRSIMTEV